MSSKSTQPLKGFKDRYPEDIALQEYLFNTVKSVAALYGFQQYDGPLVEPIELYEGKTSRELLEEQAFTLKDRNDNTLMLRPEMTPTLARMVAARYQQLNLPIRLFNIGRRFRYEAPQKGRDREFYQMDFDILGSNSDIADAEILAVVVSFLTGLGATPDDVVVYINARDIMSSALSEAGVPDDATKDVIRIIDRKEKISDEEFSKALSDLSLDASAVESITTLLNDPDAYEKKFESFMNLVDSYGISDFIEVNPTIVRGLDYYTGLVFEAKSKGTLSRSLLGGGRYDNLVGMFGVNDQIPGIGFATSDTVLLEFLRESGLLPDLKQSSSKVLVSIFDDTTRQNSVQIAQKLRESDISCELYPGKAKLAKQFKYANGKNIPYVIVVGPEEIENDTVVLKDMASGEQKALKFEQLLSELS